MESFENNEFETEPEVSAAVPAEPAQDAADDGAYHAAGTGRRESPYAGSPYEMNHQAQSSYHSAQTPPAHHPHKAKKNRKPIWKGILAGVLAIALVACGESSVNDLMRCEILKGYLYTRGCPNPDDAIFFYRERVDESFEAFWEKRENFDAVICPNDYVALCFIRYCKEHGLRVPEDLYVAAFSNRTLSRYCKPSITSMSINFVDVGECSYYAWEFLENHKMEDHQIHITTPSSLIVRESTAYEMHEMDTENAILLDAAHQGGPFYSEPVIANVMHVENCLTQCDALNLKIIQGILNGESYDSIEDRLFLSRSALNYRLKKIFTYAQTQNRKELESLFRHYFTKENNL